VSIGYPITKVDLDNRMGGMVVALRDAFDAVVLFKASLLDDATMLPDATLTALGYTGSSSSGEIQQIRNAFTSLSLLNTVSRGGSTVPSVVDFWFDAKHLANLNFH
jgi:hypothetical protein